MRCVFFPLGYLSEDEGLLVIGGVQSIVHHHACAELLTDGISRQAVHVDLHIRADFLIRQELAGEHLKQRGGRHSVFFPQGVDIVTVISEMVLFSYEVQTSTISITKALTPKSKTSERLLWL